MYSQLVHLIYFTLQCVVISSAKEVDVFYHCFSVGWLGGWLVYMQDYAKITGWISTKPGGRTGNGPRKNPLLVLLHLIST